jgi:hypothetical protein
MHLYVIPDEARGDKKKESYAQYEEPVSNVESAAS